MSPTQLPIQATTGRETRPAHPRSCAPCAKRKTKCDKVQPCSSCILRSTVAFCYASESTSSSGTLTEAVERFQGSSSSAQASPLSGGSPVQTHPPLKPSGGPTKRKRATIEIRDEAAENLAVATSRAAKASRNSEMIRQQISNMRASISALEDLLSEHSAQGGEEHPSAIATLEVSQGFEIDGNLSRTAGQFSENDTSVIPRPIQQEGQEDEVEWEQIAPFLPSFEKCTLLFEFFFDELEPNFFVLHRTTYYQHWQRLGAGEGVCRNEAAILVMVLAIAGLLIPAASPLINEFDVSPRKRHPKWYRLAFDLLEKGTDVLSRPDTSFSRVLADTVAMMYLTFAGLHDATWQHIGVAVRRAQSIHLFDETHRSWRREDLTDVKREYRRRVAYQLMIVDRWQCWHFMRQWAIIPAFFNVDPPNFDPDEAYDDETGARKPSYPPPNPLARLARVEFADFLVQGVMHLRSLPTLPPQERYANARKLVELLERNLVNSLASLDLTVEDVSACKREENKESYKKMSQAVLWYSSSFYLRCMITRPFLEDAGAPADIKFSALLYARRIIECLPLILALATSPWVPFHASWNSTHLLSAATTFAIPFLSQDLEEDGQSTGASTSLVLGNNHSLHYWPKAELDWFAEKVFDVLNGLTKLSKQGSYAARVSEVLLQNLCTSRKELKERYAARKEEDRNYRANASGIGLLGYHRGFRPGGEGASPAHLASQSAASVLYPPAEAAPNAPGTTNVVGSVPSQLPPTSAQEQHPAMVSSTRPPIPLTSRRPQPHEYADSHAPIEPGAAYLAQSTPSSHAFDLPMFGIGTWTQSTASAEPTFPAYHHGNPFPRQEQDSQYHQNAGRSEAQAQSQQPQSFMEGYMMSPSEWAEFALGLEVKT